MSASWPVWKDSGTFGKHAQKAQALSGFFRVHFHSLYFLKAPCAALLYFTSQHFST